MTFDKDWALTVVLVSSIRENCMPEKAFFPEFVLPQNIIYSERNPTALA